MIIIFYNKYLITNEAKPFNVPIIFTETFFPNINDKDNEHQKLENNESTNSPNIYWVHMDGMPSVEFINKYYNRDLSEFNNFMIIIHY